LAISLFSPIRIRTKNENLFGLALGPMAVRPEFQNQSIGSELIRQGLELCQKQGQKIVVVIGHPGYYHRFGFVPARSGGLEAPVPVPDEAFMVMELVREALDGVSGMVIYPPPFDEM
jgi:putative acetyltransferase